MKCRSGPCRSWPDELVSANSPHVKCKFKTPGWPCLIVTKVQKIIPIYVYITVNTDYPEHLYSLIPHLPYGFKHLYTVEEIELQQTFVSDGVCVPTVINYFNPFNLADQNRYERTCTKTCKSRWDGSWRAVSSGSTLFAIPFLIFDWNSYLHQWTSPNSRKEKSISETHGWKG